MAFFEHPLADPMAKPISIAFFITSHGYGHAGRAAALMLALQQTLAGCRFTLLTAVDPVFFQQSVIQIDAIAPFDIDFGLCQRSPLVEDLPATCNRLDRMLPYDTTLIDEMAAKVHHAQCQLVICDIAAVGVLVAKKLNLPSVLVENFTWDWIYAAYARREPQFSRHAAYLAKIYAQAAYRVQTQPLCHKHHDAFEVGPMARTPRTPPAETRRRLGIADHVPMVLVTMGGVPERFRFLDARDENPGVHLVIPSAGKAARNRSWVTMLADPATYYHPDLTAAADVLVGKAGYSTIAEAYCCGTPFVYVTRTNSPESATLERFVRRRMPFAKISPNTYADGTWIPIARSLAEQKAQTAEGDNGALPAARRISALLRVGQLPTRGPNR